MVRLSSKSGRMSQFSRLHRTREHPDHTFRIFAALDFRLGCEAWPSDILDRNQIPVSDQQKTRLESDFNGFVPTAFDSIAEFIEPGQAAEDFLSARFEFK